MRRFPAGLSTEGRAGHCLRRLFFLAALFIGAVQCFPASPKAQDLAAAFSKHAANSAKTIDHSEWDALLKAYVEPGQDGLNRVNYPRFKAEGRAKLKAYLGKLQAADVAGLNRQEQFAFWVNLYNAKTIDVVLERYPVKSIRDIDISGLFADGPWGAAVLKVQGYDLTLDNIEHGILRKVWSDPRVHYAVNCASVGCPNLAADAYTGATLEAMLDKAARSYVNSPRGVRFETDKLTLSSIYKWFAKDFGSDTKQVLAHLGRYAEPDLAKRLSQTDKISGYGYDWSLNDAKR